MLNAGLDPEIMVRLKSIDAMKDIADGQATKVFVPNDIAASLSAFGSIGEVMGTVKEPAKSQPRKEFQKTQAIERARKALEKDPCLDEGSSAGTVSSAMANAHFNDHR